MTGPNPPGDATDGEHEAWQGYLESCTAYIRRQVLVYQNWPQRRYGPTGYEDEKIFRDMNA